MSVAPECPPVVYIPPRARPRSSARSAHLRLLPPVVPDGALTTGSAPEPSRPAAVRLTSRGLAVLTLLALAAVLLLARVSAPPPPAGHRVPAPAVVTVRDGDTLWSIAGSVAPGRDPRAVVDELRRLNGLPGATLVPGQRLRTR